ncbi:hypothetical protein LPB136_02025 [Tenacibaculum todarodis]|uniref:DUF11 domain-containing protein n=1 Tax=Tenacibaculum todarodis TaxID=1850252 RepID=A0A1L3JGF2_9FLAO|nr:DUF11 domain-containing protein [Tenacibaculum todarodis]APG64217.1 hypothetical protein LPB136_02025 [Tenacibaculum todarodis]
MDNSYFLVKLLGKAIVTFCIATLFLFTASVEAQNSGAWTASGSGATTTWSANNGQTGANLVNISLSATNYGSGTGFTLNDFTTGEFLACSTGFSDPSMVSNPSLSLRHTFQNSAFITINFSSPVVNPVIHIDRLGGGGGPGGQTTSSMLRVITPGITLTELSQNDTHFITDEVNQTITRESGTLPYNNVNAGECGAPEDDPAAGSVRLNGTFNSVTFEVSMNQDQPANVNDRFEIAFSNVVPATIEAVNDNFTANVITPTGGSPGNVLANDDYNGATPVDADVDITVTNTGGLTGVTIDNDGNIIVPANTPANNYTVTYQICQTGGTTLCDTATVLITVSCDSDGDGVCDDVDKCEGFDDAIDSDNDTIPDGCDLDNDNDGILDTDENASCGITNTTLLFQDFGNAPNATPSSSVTLASLNPGITTAYGYDALSNPYAGNDLNDDFYSVFNNIPESAAWATSGSDVWQTIGDHTDGGATATAGRMLMVNAGNTLDAIYQQTLTGVGTGALIDVSFWVLNLDYDKPSSNGRALPNIQIELWQNGAILGTPINTGDIPREARGDVNAWKKFETTSPIKALDNSDITLILRNNVSNTNGNDLAIDDILVTQACDTDGDGTPNYLDLDSDNDGCPDALEGNGGVLLSQLNADGSINTATNPVNDNGIPVGPGTAGNGITGQDDVSSTNANVTGDQCDDDGDGVPNVTDKCDGFNDNLDFDNDTVPDGCDDDADNDGILDVNEQQNAACEKDLSLNLNYNGADFDIGAFEPVSVGTVLDATISIEVDDLVGFVEGDISRFIFNYSTSGPSNIPTTRVIQNSGDLYEITVPYTVKNGDDLSDDDYYCRGHKISFTSIFIELTNGVVMSIPDIIDQDICGSGNTVRPYTFTYYDCDNDGQPNELDTDSDNDGCPDAVEGAGTILSNDAALTNLTDGSNGGSIQNLGTVSDAEGNPIYPSSGTAGYEHATAPAVIDASINACQADLSLTKSVDTALPKIGGNIVYTLTVANNGVSNATGVQVTDVLPAGLTFVSDNSSTTSTTYTGNVWDIGNLNVNQTVSLQITATVNGAGTIINTAEITQSNQTDLDSTPASGN